MFWITSIFVTIISTWEKSIWEVLAASRSHPTHRNRMSQFWEIFSFWVGADRYIAGPLFKVHSSFLRYKVLQTSLVVAPRFDNFDDIDFFAEFFASLLHGHLTSVCLTAYAFGRYEANEPLFAIRTILQPDIVRFLIEVKIRVDLLGRLLDFEQSRYHKVIKRLKVPSRYYGTEDQVKKRSEAAHFR